VVEHLHVAVVHAETLFHGAPAGKAAGAQTWQAIAAAHAGQAARVGIPMLGAVLISFLTIQEARHARAEWGSSTR
jgi:hypothetical protein